MNQPDLSFDDALKILSDHAADADGTRAWPDVSWSTLCRAGVPGWNVPAAHGGSEWSSIEILDGYIRLAGACLTTTFLLSQRDAAVRRLRDSDNSQLKDRLLPELAGGNSFATVGLSQLTTSRQHTQPALVARRQGDRYILNGVMPWVTGALRADYFVTGAVTDDGRQVLICLPRRTPGIEVAEPLALAALEGSLTARVHCQDAEVDASWLVQAPGEQVVQSGKGGTGGLETSALAVGLAAAAADYLHRESEKRPEWSSSARACGDSVATLRTRLFDLATGGGTATRAADVRAQANTLVLRATQLALAAAKGEGFLRSHAAQRHARQALFFLVWSCPRPALEGTMAHLQPLCDE